MPSKGSIPSSTPNSFLLFYEAKRFCDTASSMDAQISLPPPQASHSCSPVSVVSGHMRGLACERSASILFRSPSSA